MRYLRMTGTLLVVATVALALAGAGCNRSGANDRQAKSKIGSTNAKGEGATTAAHEGWWCQEHGIPEEMCSICMSEANAKKKFKDNGDWCKEHDRAESQCFKCHPKRYKKFEDIYVAKYGKKPGPPPEEEFTR